jgi:hypothetical protein
MFYVVRRIPHLFLHSSPSIWFLDARRTQRAENYGLPRASFRQEDAIYPANATGFNLQTAKHKAVANVTHAR